MMPYHSLALLAILALGSLWLLGEYTTTSVTFVQSFIGHALFVGFFLLLIHYSTLDDGKLTQTIHFNRLGSPSTPQVRVQRNNTSSHRCNWCCHQNFDNNNCPLLCGDHCIHPYCMNHYCPYLFPPPNPTPFPSTSASLPFQTISAPIPCQYYQSIRVHLYNPSILPILKHSSILHTPMASSIICCAKLSLMAPLPTCPIPLEAMKLMQLRHPSESLLTNLRNSSPTVSLSMYRCRHQIANRHGVRRSGQDAGSPPVHSLPNVRRDLFSHRTSFHWISTLGRLNMARIRAR